MSLKIDRNLKKRFLRIIQGLKDSGEIILASKIQEYLKTLHTLYLELGDDLEDFVSYCYGRASYFKVHDDVYWMFRGFDRLPLHKLSNSDFMTIEIPKYRESKSEPQTSSISIRKKPDFDDIGIKFIRKG